MTVEDPRREMEHALLEAAVGTRLATARRIHWTHGDRVEEEMGPLELVFDGGPTLVLITGSDGEWARVDPRPWIDFMEDDPSDEDREYAETHGRMRRIDVSALPGYADAVGRTLDAVRWLATGWGSLSGVEMAFGPARLTFVSWGDEEYVFTGGADAVPAEWGFRPAGDTSNQIGAR